MTSNSSISLLSVDELSNVLSFITPKQLIKCCISINKSFNAAIYHGNSWNSTRLSSRQILKCNNDQIFSNFVKYSWNSLSRFSFMNYKTALNPNQKQMLNHRLLSILNSSHNTLQSVQLHGVDISSFHGDDTGVMKPLDHITVLWIVTPKRDNPIMHNVWTNFIASNHLVTLEFMSNFPLELQDIIQLTTAFDMRQNTKYNLKNLKLTIASDLECNREITKMIDVLSDSLEIVYIQGMKYIHNADTGIADVLCKCKALIAVSLMYRNQFDVTDLYTHQDCYNLLYELTFSLLELKVLSLDYGPLVDYAWQERYKEHIKLYGKSLIWLKIGQNRIKNPFLWTVISPNIKCNRFCLSWNVNA
eukprot:608341_1